MDEEGVTAHLSHLADDKDFQGRVEHISSLLLGQSYQANPLVGGYNTDEQFTFSATSFDCVTYCEYCIAIAGAPSYQCFCERLQSLRYREGNVSWLDRNHYMYHWIEENIASGLLERILDEYHSLTLPKSLSCLEHYPATDVILRLIPLDRLPEVLHDIETGDIILFGSTRADLDVFHMGIAIKSGPEVRLRHAAQSTGTVGEEPLDDFLKRNEMSGIMIVRPKHTDENS